MNSANISLKRCGEQRFEGTTKALTNNRNITQTLIAIARKISHSAHQQLSSKEIKRAAIIEIEKARSEFNA